MKKLLSLVMIAACIQVSGQVNPSVQKGLTPPVTFTTAQDHQNMMDQLGIKALRPGPSGNEQAPNHANYDESIATPYPDPPI